MLLPLPTDEPLGPGHLIQGVDVWLNTPLRPMEASGTSGMKAAANGTLNLSTLDGWWDEAWREAESPLIGWAIGRGEAYPSQETQDQVEAEALYELLEREVVPTFYQRGVDRLPRQWTERMKASLGCLCFQFNTHRMVQQYADGRIAEDYGRFGQLFRPRRSYNATMLGPFRSHSFPSSLRRRGCREAVRLSLPAAL